MKNVLVILKEPFLDRIPSLKTLLLYLCDLGVNVTVLTSKSNRFGTLTTVHPNLDVVCVKERLSKFELPTTAKLALKSITYLITHRIDAIIGGDLWGNVIANKLRHLFKGNYIFFALEYPQIIDEKHPQLSRADKMQNEALCKADYIITHDDFHLDFISKNFNINKEKILKLANASFTPPIKSQTDYLRDYFNIDHSDIVVLHSGGFGKWFKCEDLANASKSWSKKIHLVFHIGRKPNESPEFDGVYNKPGFEHIEFSLDPLSNNELDNMIASADIGVALYSTNELGYRAELMGLAAGKIGNYLKCGIPVIASALPSLKYIEDFKCGILVHNEADIESAINKIMGNYQEYRDNAFLCYINLWHPQNYLKKIATSLGLPNDAV